jgi:hypothetical protein
MARKIGNSFGNFQEAKPFTPGVIKPIKTEFSKGSIPDSIYAANRESAWSRWRKGYELANAYTYNNEYTFPFTHETPNATTSGNPNPVISGAFVGFPTSNKDLGMHWSIWRYAGSVRCDKLTDPISSQKLFVETVTEDANYWYVKLAGTWSSANPLPAPFYIPVSGQPDGLKPANTEIFEDRILVSDGPIITSDTINPQTQTRYGYVQAVVININQNTGILTFKKAGSVYVSPDKQFITPSPVGFAPGRFLITGSRYVCTCQDFTHRDYSFVMGAGTTKQQFPRTGVSSVKPGRYEITQVSGVIDNNAMTRPGINRGLDVYAPEGFELDYTVTNNSNIDLKSTRDNPGVYREFGAIYKRATTNIALPGSTAEGMPGYDDYSATNLFTDSNSISQDVILSVSDNWTPLLDELRYCKHIYALKFRDRLFPPEPSDFPVGITGMAEWEQRLVKETEVKIQKDREYRKTLRSLSVMDVPPYNAQSPMLFPVIQKLFNIATDKILIENFTMLK